MDYDWHDYPPQTNSRGTGRNGSLTEYYIYDYIIIYIYAHMRMSYVFRYLDTYEYYVVEMYHVYVHICT